MRKEIAASDRSLLATDADTNVKSGASRRVTSDARPSERLVEMTALLNDMVHAADEKVNLAKATYDSVGGHLAFFLAVSCYCHFLTLEL